MNTTEDTTATRRGSGSNDLLGPTPERRQVKPALGYKHHAERVRNTGTHMEATAAFIEAQNAEIEYLYRALQGVRDRAKRAGSRNQVAASICSEANFALQYGA